MTSSESFLQSLHGVANLSHWGVIQAQGEDAVSFLHNQLTQDLQLLKAPGARLAAFCSAQGRIQASFIAIKVTDERVLLVVSKDLLASTLKRLTLFVLRAKVKLSDASDQFHVLGLLGSVPTEVAPTAAPWECATHGQGWDVALYPMVHGHQTVLRRLRIVSAAEPVLTPHLSLDQWLWSEVQSGVCLIQQAVYEAFVPQMLNYESVGGVNFKKGCYPGQEVVARSQFRGTLKRRLALAHSPIELAAGQEIFTPTDLTQPCGKVVLCAPRPHEAGSGFDALISGTLQSLEQGWVSHAQGGQPLTLHPLPYPLLEDI